MNPIQAVTSTLCHVLSTSTSFKPSLYHRFPTIHRTRLSLKAYVVKVSRSRGFTQLTPPLAPPVGRQLHLIRYIHSYPSYLDVISTNALKETSRNVYSVIFHMFFVGYLE
jgi:hypothetical protein